MTYEYIYNIIDLIYPVFLHIQIQDPKWLLVVTLNVTLNNFFYFHL